MTQFKNIIPVLFFTFIIVFFSCSGQPKEKTKSPAQNRPPTGEVQENRSTVQAEILDVKKLNDKNFELKLVVHKILSSSKNSFTSVGDTLLVYPKFRISEGQTTPLDLKNPQNEHLFSILQLNRGHRIEAELTLGGGEISRHWWLLNWRDVSKK